MILFVLTILTSLFCSEFNIITSARTHQAPTTLNQTVTIYRAFDVSAINEGLGVLNAYRFNNIFVISEDTEIFKSKDLGNSVDFIYDRDVTIHENDTSIFVIPFDISEQNKNKIINNYSTPFIVNNEYYDLSKYKIKTAELGKVIIGDKEYVSIRLKDDKIPIENKWYFTITSKVNIKINNKSYIFYDIGKDIGSLWKAHEGIKNLAYSNKQSLIINTGNVNDEYGLNSYKILNVNFPQIYVIGSRELINLKYIKEVADTKPQNIDFISINVYDKNNKRAFKPYKIVEMDSIKVAVIGLTDTKLVDYNFEGYFIKKIEDIEDFNSIIFDLRSKADLIILASNIKPDKVEGVDIVIYDPELDRDFNYDLKTVLDFKEYKNRLYRSPLLETTATSTNLGLLNIKIENDDITIKQSKYNLDYHVKGYVPFNLVKTNTLLTTSTDDNLLPDPKSIIGNDDPFTQIDSNLFSSIAAYFLKLACNTEIGIFNTQSQDSSRVGQVSEKLLRSWIDNSEFLVEFEIPGKDLLALYNFNESSFIKSKKLSFSYVDSQTIDGKSISKNEYYKVATTSSVLKVNSFSPFLNKIKNKKELFSLTDGKYKYNSSGNQVLIEDVIVNSIKQFNQKYKGTEQYLSLLKSIFNKQNTEEKTKWLINFKDISLNYNSLRINNQDNLSSVIEPNLSSANQTNIAANIETSVELRKKYFEAELGTKLNYGKTKIFVGNEVAENILNDLANVFLETRYPYIFNEGNYDWFYQQSGPYIKLFYDTQFKPLLGKERQKLLGSILGWSTQQGSLFKNTFLGLVIENQFSTNDNLLRYGLNFTAEVNRNFSNDILFWKSTINAKYLFPYKRETIENVSASILIDNSFQAYIYNNLSFGPFVNYYVFNSRILHSTATQFMIGVKLMISGVWKPEYNVYAPR